MSVSTPTDIARSGATLPVLAHAERTLLAAVLDQVSPGNTSDQGLLATAAAQVQAMPALLEQLLGFMQQGQGDQAQTLLEQLLGPVRKLDQNETLVNAATGTMFAALDAAREVISTDLLPARTLTDATVLLATLRTVEAVRDAAENLAQRLEDRVALLNQRPQNGQH